MTNPENLIPIKKGEVRNTKGRGQVLGFKAIAKRYAEAMSKGQNPFTGKLETVDPVTRLYLQLNYIALKGRNDNAKINAIREILDRIEGKVKQNEDSPVTNIDKQINVYYNDRKLDGSK